MGLLNGELGSGILKIVVVLELLSVNQRSFCASSDDATGGFSYSPSNANRSELVTQADSTNSRHFTDNNINNADVNAKNTSIVSNKLDALGERSIEDNSADNDSSDDYNELESESAEDEDDDDHDVSDSSIESDNENSVPPSSEKPQQQQLPDVHGGTQPVDAVSVIDSSFVNRKTFSCPKIKEYFVTGTDTGDLSPEDIRIIAAMGDSLATGKGLWPRTDIEFRGAAFPIGGDATIDGLVTIANILHEFNDKLVGVSHGMGTRSQLPDHQLNVAESGATTWNLPEQAIELVRRIRSLKEVDVEREWTMVIIAIGTEEVCTSCEPPNENALLDAIQILNSGVPKVFVVLLGPINVASSYRRSTNLLRTRCDCLSKASAAKIRNLSRSWTSTFGELQAYFEQPLIKRREFGLLVLPMLTITSRQPNALFMHNRPLLNRKGHTYATKWLWNRLVTGPTYNQSLAVLSQDAYYCPAMDCPYFRTAENRYSCRLLRHVDVIEGKPFLFGNGKIVTRRSRRKLYLTTIVVVTICFFTALFISTLLYQKSKYEYKMREEDTLFDETP